MSDLHLEMMNQGYTFQLPDSDAEVLIFLGDIGTRGYGLEWAIRECDRLGKIGIYVPGNHEFWGNDIYKHDLELKNRAFGSSVHYLNMGEFIIDDVRFLGCTMWTDLSHFGDLKQNVKSILKKMLDYERIMCQQSRTSMERYCQNFTPEEALHIHYEHRKWLHQKLNVPFPGKTVLLTHHGVSKACHTDKFEKSIFTTAFWSDMDDELSGQIDLACFGHTHVNVDTTSPTGFKVFSNQAGYRQKATDKCEPSFGFNRLINTNDL